MNNKDDEFSISSENSFINKHVNKKKMITFLSKSKEGGNSYKQSWLSQAANTHHAELTKQYKSSQVDNKNKFKYLFQIPQVITDPKLVGRRSTYEVFTKDSQLELYYMQLKKAKGIARSISQKADFKDIVTQINNNKLQNNYVNQLKKNTGQIHTNELWSSKHQNQIYDQARLKKLSEMMEMRKIQMSSEEQLLQFQQFHERKRKVDNKKIGDMIHDIAKYCTIDETLKLQPLLSPSINQIDMEEQENINNNNAVMNYEIQEIVNTENNYSTKPSQGGSRFGLRSKLKDTRPQTREVSEFSKRDSITQYGKRNSIGRKSNYSIQEILTPQQKMNELIKDSLISGQDTKYIIHTAEDFLQKEMKLNMRGSEMQQQKIRIRHIKQALEQSKYNQMNSHISEDVRLLLQKK